jgi:hypothetical protein
MTAATDCGFEILPHSPYPLDLAPLTSTCFRNWNWSFVVDELKTSFTFVQMFTICWPSPKFHRRYYNAWQHFTNLVLSESKIIIRDLSKYLFFIQIKSESSFAELQTSFIMNSYLSHRTFMLFEKSISSAKIYVVHVL